MTKIKRSISDFYELRTKQLLNRRVRDLPIIVKNNEKKFI